MNVVRNSTLANIVRVATVVHDFIVINNANVHELVRLFSDAACTHQRGKARLGTSFSDRSTYAIIHQPYEGRTCNHFELRKCGDGYNILLFAVDPLRSIISPDVEAFLSDA